LATPTSSVPRLKAALVRLFAADTTLSAVASDWAPPPPDRLKHSHIWIGEVKDMAREPKIGGQSRRERYTLDVIFSVGRGGYDGQAIEEAAWALVNAFELAVNADPRLDAFDGGQMIGQPFQCTIGGMGQRSFPALEGGWTSEITVSLDCMADLRNQ
jgi:hypothetical protein